MTNKKTILLFILGAFAAVMSFQNCGNFQSAGDNMEIDEDGQLIVESFSSETGNTTSTILSSQNGNQDASNLNSNRSGKVNKLGIIYGPNATQASIDETQDIGGWYYTYSPHPNRNEKNVTNTVRMANKYKKEFVPMISINRFKYGPGPESCPILEMHAQNGEKVCDLKDIENSLRNIIQLFDKDIRPKHIIILNEPWQAGGQNASTTGVKHLTTPWQAARIYSIIEKVASKLNLSVVSPTFTSGAHTMVWFSEFLKRCYDMRGDKDYPCRLSHLRTFAYHDYKCTEAYFKNTLIGNSIRKKITGYMKNPQGQWYGGFNWGDYINRRKMWLTETSCNWDSDFANAQQKNGRYIRSQKESCLRASGQKSGYGSLKVLASLGDNHLERFAWWTTYANPAKDTDTGQINQSSKNRIDAARLVDDKMNLTAMGEVIEALFYGDNLKAVRCRN